MGEGGALAATVSKEQAVARMRAHDASWLVRLAGKPGVLRAVECVFLPFWSYAFRASRADGRSAGVGRLAIETWTHAAAIVPDHAQASTPPENAELLPAAAPPDEDTVRQVLFWEAMAHKRRERPSHVDLEPPTLLYVPYWLGYRQDAQWDICPVDATTGKLDLSMKDALTAALTAL